MSSDPFPPGFYTPPNMSRGPFARGEDIKNAVDETVMG